MWIKLGLTVLLLSEIMGIVNRIFLEKCKKINFKKIKERDDITDKEKSNLVSVIVEALVIILLGFPLYILSVIVIAYGIVSLCIPAMFIGLLYVLTIIFKYKKYPTILIIDTIISIGLIIWWATLI